MREHVVVDVDEVAGLLQRGALQMRRLDVLHERVEDRVDRRQDRGEQRLGEDGVREHVAVDVQKVVDLLQRRPLEMRAVDVVDRRLRDRVGAAFAAAAGDVPTASVATAVVVAIATTRPRRRTLVRHDVAMSPTSWNIDLPDKGGQGDPSPSGPDCRW